MRVVSGGWGVFPVQEFSNCYRWGLVEDWTTQLTLTDSSQSATSSIFQRQSCAESPQPSRPSSPRWKADEHMAERAAPCLSTAFCLGCCWEIPFATLPMVTGGAAGWLLRIVLRGDKNVNSILSFTVHIKISIIDGRSDFGAIVLEVRNWGEAKCWEKLRKRRTTDVRATIVSRALLMALGHARAITASPTDTTFPHRHQGLLLLARIVHARFAACHLKSCAANENNQTEIVSVNKLIIKINWAACMCSRFSRCYLCCFLSITTTSSRWGNLYSTNVRRKKNFVWNSKSREMFTDSEKHEEEK